MLKFQTTPSHFDPFFKWQVDTNHWTIKSEGLSDLLTSLRLPCTVHRDDCIFLRAELDLIWGVKWRKETQQRFVVRHLRFQPPPSGAQRTPRAWCERADTQPGIRRSGLQTHRHLTDLSNVTPVPRVSLQVPSNEAFSLTSPCWF